MPRLTACLVVIATVMAPLSARADLLSLLLAPLDGQQQTGPEVAVLGAGAAATLLAGAAVTAHRELHRPKEALPAGIVEDPQGKQPMSLLLLPPAFDPYLESETPPPPSDADQKKARRHDAAVRFNENATNAMLAVTGAAMLGAIIATLAKGK